MASRGAPPSSGSSDRRQELENAIAKEETGLRRLEAEQAEAQVRLSVLRSELAALDHVPEPAPEQTAPLTAGPRTPADKVRLFRQLFRGRPDIYPTRFVSKKTGKPGYAPACSNKFVPGICELPKVKCGDCTRQVFRPVDDAAVLAHLKGQHVMGVYAMLDDETCWFLAVDFDKRTWAEDVRAFVDTAQDTMPRGGFGNLIALPLQHGPRQEGNSVFLDDSLVAFPGEQQWAFLASIERIDPMAAERIASEATRTGSVVGLRLAGVAGEDDAAPWTRMPSGKPRAVRIAEALPKRVSAVLAQRLFVEKAGLPSPLLDQIKRLAAFQNPEFYKKQSMRLSTAMTPRVISCAEDRPQHVALPRGCRSELEELLRGHGVGLDVEDQRAGGTALDLRFQGTLTAVQGRPRELSWPTTPAFSSRRRASARR